MTVTFRSSDSDDYSTDEIEQIDQQNDASAAVVSSNSHEQVNDELELFCI